MLTSELYMHLALKGVGYIMFTNHYSYIRLRELSLPFHKLLILVLGITWSFNMYTTLNMLWSLDNSNTDIHMHASSANYIILYTNPNAVYVSEEETWC